MEKQDFIIANQQQRLSKVSKQLQAIDAVFDNLAEAVYEEACDLIITEVVEDTTANAVANVERFREEGYLKKEYYSFSDMNLVRRAIGKVVDRIKEKAAAMIEWLKFSFMEADKKAPNVEKIRSSMVRRLDDLALGKKVTEDEEVNEMAKDMADTVVRRRRRGR